MSSSSSHLPSVKQIEGACASIGYNLGSLKYAVVGGAACQLLGSSRITEDVDFVVLKGGVSAARKLLAADDRFTIEPRTLHTHYKTTPPVEIEILAPPGTFKENFGQDTHTVSVEVDGRSVSILHPTLILNAKCRSILGRANALKKESDAYDIKYLLQYLASARTFPTSQSLPNASKAFVEWFVAAYGGEDLWKGVKYDAATVLGLAFLFAGLTEEDLEKANAVASIRFPGQYNFN